MRYYGGAEGNVLVYHPTQSITPVLKQRPSNKDGEDNAGEDGEQVDGGGGGGGGGDVDDDDDGVTIHLPPPGTVPFSGIYLILFNVK
jgi:hypothetical protein